MEKIVHVCTKIIACHQLLEEIKRGVEEVEDPIFQEMMRTNVDRLSLFSVDRMVVSSEMWTRVADKYLRYFDQIYGKSSEEVAAYLRTVVEPLSIDLPSPQR